MRVHFSFICQQILFFTYSYFAILNLTVKKSTIFSLIYKLLTTINYISSGHSIPNNSHASYNIFCTQSVKIKRAFFSFSLACKMLQS